MTKKYTLYISCLLLLIFLPACKGFKDTKIGHWYHNTTARFNGYFNAKEKMIVIEDNLFDQHVDNFNNVIDVFTIADEKSPKSTGTDADIVIKKCSRVIRKHDVSKWVKNCYFLIGKSNFYKRDYYTAQETFEYVNDRYPNTRVGQESLIWMVRCSMELKKLNDAQGTLAILDKSKKLSEDVKPYLHLVEADYYIRTEDYKRAAEKMELALPHYHKKKYKTRYMFILAQLYQRMGENAKAEAYYKKVIKKNPVYELSFQSRLGLADVSTNQKEVEKYLTKLLKDEKNSAYYDQIYYVLAKAEMKQGNIPQAIDYLKLSARASKLNRNQKAMSFMMLADIYFKIPEYPAAKAYYDSASKFIDPTYPGYDAFKARQGVLSDLITNLITIQQNDSLLRLAKMDSSTLSKFIDDLIQKEQKKAAEQAMNNINGSPGSGNNPAFNTPASMADNFINQDESNTKAGYFYNPSALSMGYSDFINRWGNRAKADDWRRKNKPVANTENPNDKIDTFISNKAGNNTPSPTVSQLAPPNVPAARQKYYVNIPFTQSAKNIDNSKIEQALINEGNIYYTSLNDPVKAAQTYEELLQRYPNGNHILEAHYNLYQIYSNDTANAQKAQYHKDFILKNYPSSTYATLIANPDQLRAKFIERNKNEDLERLYLDAYNSFQAGNCDAVIKDENDATAKYGQNYLKARFAYLHTLCNGKNQTPMVFMDSLKNYNKRYPGNEVSKQVDLQINYLQEQINNALNKPAPVPEKDSTAKKPGEPEKSPFVKSLDEPHSYVIVFPKTSNANVVKTAFSNYNSDNFADKKLDMLSFLIDNDNQVLVIKTFDNAKDALSYFESVQRIPSFFSDLNIKTHQEFIISDTNLATMVKRKNVNEYIKFYKDNYL